MTSQLRVTADGSEARPVRRLTILYDERSPRTRRWIHKLERRRFRIPVELLPAGSRAARARYPHVEPWLGRRLVVVDNEARAWVGEPAHVMVLWATERYRSLSDLATRRWLAPFATRVLRRHSPLRPVGRHRQTGYDSDWVDRVRLEETPLRDLWEES
jgi:hypothetical protein